MAMKSRISFLRDSDRAEALPLPQRFFDTLALILSRRENMEITVRVTSLPEEQGKQQQKEAV